jgi:GBP family porin
MKRNKIHAATSVAAFLVATGGTAHADITAVSNDKVHVDFYGVLDVAYGTVQHSLGINSQYAQSINAVSPTPIKASAADTSAGTQAPSTVSGLFNGGLQDPRFGFKGGLDLGNSWNAFFTLEEGVNLTTGQVNNSAAALAQNGGVATSAATGGSLNGQLFNRQAVVGLSSDKLGSIALGRNYAPIYDVVSTYDPVQFAQLFSPLGFSNTYSGGGGVSEDARVQDSLKYSNKIGPVNFGALYKYKGTVGDSTAKSAYAFNAGYVEGNLGIQAAYQVFNDALKGSPGLSANTVAVSAYDTKAFTIAAKYKFNDAFKAKIGFETYTLSAASDSIGTTASPLTTLTYYGQSISKVTANTTIAPQKTNIAFIGGDYNFTEKFNLAAGIYDISLQQSADYTPNAGTTTAKTGQASGDQRYYSLLADYHFTKALDSYAGVMYSTYSGNANPSASYYQSNQIIAVGTRFTF